MDASSSSTRTNRTQEERGPASIHTDGTPDLTFGGGTGKVVPAQKVCTRGISYRVYALDLQPEGKIVVALAAPGLTAQVYAVGA